MGTALNQHSRVWFTLSHGILNEIYFPRVDQACTRDQGLLITDGARFFSEEKRHCRFENESLEPGVPVYELTNTENQGRYKIYKEVFSDPYRNVVVQKIRFEPLEGKLADFRLYALLAPHLANCGAGNTGWIGDYKGVPMLFAEHTDTALAFPQDEPARERDLYRPSVAVLRSHESKDFLGGVIASLSIPWGFNKGDEDLGGYHLVWPRDLVETALGFLAAGAELDALRVLRYLESTQEADGHWAQNLWLDGRPYWGGMQMDETAFPILLVDMLQREAKYALGDLQRCQT